MEKKILLTKQQLWDFMYSQICKTLGISKFDLAISKNYKNMMRRFNYFVRENLRRYNR
ncbi:MAG: hypothetical protein AABY22_07665 [Nanoarchaeota archaeon]